MTKYQASIFIYALAMIALGFAGHFMSPTHEWISTIAGGAIGVIAIFFGTLSKSNPRVGFIGASVLALLVDLKFIPALISPKPGPIWHVWTIVVCSTLLIAFLLGGHFLARKGKASSA